MTYQQPHGAPQQPYGAQQLPAGDPGVYGASYAAASAALKANAKGWSLTSFILGLANIFVGAMFVTQIFGIIAGFIGLSKEPAGKGFAIWGLVLNFVTIVGWAIFWVAMVALALSPLLLLPFLVSYDY